jgi:hypothetical protein
LEAGAQAVRQADPEAKVVMGGIAWNLGFLEAMLTNSVALSNVDVINLHNYYETWSDEPLERIADYVKRASDLLGRYGKPLPIWTAEVGYSSQRMGARVSPQFWAKYHYEHTPKHAAASLFRILTLLLASGKVSLVTWYRINDLPPSQEVIGDVNNRHLGVVDAAGAPKPALKSLACFHSLFSQGFTCIDDRTRVTRTIGSATEVHAFERPDRSLVVIAWLRTVVPGQRGESLLNRRKHPPVGEEPDVRRETVSLVFPAGACSHARIFDEQGQLLRNVQWPKAQRAMKFEIPAEGVLVAVIPPE